MAAEPRPTASDADVAATFVAAGQAYFNHIKKPGDAKKLGGALEQINRWRTGVDKGGYGIFPIPISNIDIGLEFKLTRDINLGVFFLGARVHRNMIRKWPADRMLRLMLDNDELARRALPEILTAEASLRAAVRKSKSVFKTTCERLDADVETVRLTIAKARGSR